MPLMNSTGALKQQRSATDESTHFLYMYSGSSNPANENTVVLGSYDYSSSKYATVNGASNQILAFKNNSTIQINGTKSAYSYYSDAGSNKFYWSDSGTGIQSVDLTSYAGITFTGTSVPGTFAAITKDSTGATIQARFYQISTTYYLYVIKFNDAGTIAWQNSYSLPDAAGFFNPASICVDSSDNIYFCGQYSSTGSFNGATGMWGKIASSGTLSYMKTQSNTILKGVVCVGTSLYFSMAIASNSYNNYTRYTSSDVSTKQACIAMATASTGSFTKITWLDGGTNTLFPFGVAVDPNDATNIILYGNSYSGATPSVTVTGFVFRFTSDLNTLASQKRITFTSNLVLNPTFIYNSVYLTDVAYLSNTDSCYITGNAWDIGSSGSIGYLNGFTFRTNVNSNSTGTILDRTFTIDDFNVSFTLTDISPFTGTSFASVTTSRALTLTRSTYTMPTSGVTPTKVDL